MNRRKQCEKTASYVRHRPTREPDFVCRRHAMETVLLGVAAPMMQIVGTDKQCSVKEDDNSDG